MRRRLAIALVCVLAAFGVACEAAPPTIDPGLAVAGPGGGSTLYPDPEARDCAQVGRCADLTAEVARWAARTAPELGQPASVTFHGAIDEAGRHILLTRTGGASWIAVVRWPDGTRRAVMVGCGVGVDPVPCFSEP